MKKGILVLFMAAALLSCNKNKVFEKFIKMDNYEWPMDKTLIFEVPVEDTASLYNVIVPVRHIDNFPYDGLLVNITMYTPSGEERSKNYKLKLRDADGKFIGDPGGDIWDADVMIMEKTKFNASGTYKFEIVSTMPTTPTVCIMEVGLKVEKAD